MLQTTTCCHISKTSRDMEPCSPFPLTENRKIKHMPDPLYKTQKQLQHQIENVQDQRVKSFLGSEQRYWLRASFTYRHGKGFTMT